MNTKIGKAANYLAALILLGMGIIYLFKDSFMPYHSDAIGLAWSEVDTSTQFLILALMRAVSGGFIAVAVAIAFIQHRFAVDKHGWMPTLILISGLIVSLLSIYATLIVRFNSTAEPPTFLALIGIVLLVMGYVFNRRSLRH